jgi:methionyl-tRNA formyltransferase
MGATKFSRRCLDAVLESGQEFCGCAATPEHFDISYAPEGVRNVNYCNFVEVAGEFGVPCIAYDRKNVNSFVDEVRELQPDLLLVAGWYYIVPKKLRDVAPQGAVGLHGSLLPQFRGGAPLVWTMIHGESHGGMTLFYLDDGVDTGDIVGQQSFPIDENETIADALVSSENAAVTLLLECLPQLADDSAPRISQSEAQASEFPQRCPADGEIDWTKPAADIGNFIRAQTRPYPGAFLRINGKKVVIWDADISELEEDCA